MCSNGVKLQILSKRTGRFNDVLCHSFIATRTTL